MADLEAGLQWSGADGRAGVDVLTSGDLGASIGDFGARRASLGHALDRVLSDGTDGRTAANGSAKRSAAPDRGARTTGGGPFATNDHWTAMAEYL